MEDRFYCGHTQPCGESLMVATSFTEAKHAWADDGLFALCETCVSIQSERARARAAKQTLDTQLQKLQHQRVDLSYEIAAALQYEPGGDISDLLEDLVRVDQQELAILEQRKAQEATR